MYATKNKLMGDENGKSRGKGKGKMKRKKRNARRKARGKVKEGKGSLEKEILHISNSNKEKQMQI